MVRKEGRDLWVTAYVEMWSITRWIQWLVVWQSGMDHHKLGNDVMSGGERNTVKGAKLRQPAGRMDIRILGAKKRKKNLGLAQSGHTAKK